MTEIKKIRVVIPEESYTLMEWKEDNLPVVGCVNSALKEFEPKEVFKYHLSVEIDLKELIDNGMPSQDERAIIDPFCDRLDNEIKAGGNALFLVRETWNKRRILQWRVYDPEIAHQHLQSIIEHKLYPRPFDWHMDIDLEWKEAEWYFQQLET